MAPPCRGCVEPAERTISGGHSGGETPVPIPNTAVKPARADGTWGEAPWESRSLPGFLKDEIPFELWLGGDFVVSGVISTHPFGGRLQRRHRAETAAVANRVTGVAFVTQPVPPRSPQPNRRAQWSRSGGAARPARSAGQSRSARSGTSSGASRPGSRSAGAAERPKRHRVATVTQTRDGCGPIGYVGHTELDERPAVGRPRWDRWRRHPGRPSSRSARPGTGATSRGTGATSRPPRAGAGSGPRRSSSTGESRSRSDAPRSAGPRAPQRLRSTTLLRQFGDLGVQRQRPPLRIRHRQSQRLHQHQPGRASPPDEPQRATAPGRSGHEQA